jgi:hypothetical protein
MMKIKGLQLPMIADEIVTGDIRWVGAAEDLTSDTSGAGYGKLRTLHSPLRLTLILRG